MNDRINLKGFNDVSIDEWELRWYEEKKVERNKIEDMLRRVDKVITKANAEACIDKVKTLFGSDEKIIMLIPADPGYILEIQCIAGIAGIPIGTDWARHVIGVLTNKKLYIVYANVVFEYLKIKDIEFKEIKRVELLKMEYSYRFSIYVSEEERTVIEVYGEKYLKTIDYLKQQGVKIVIKHRTKRRKLEENMLLFIVCILIFFVLVNIADRALIQQHIYFLDKLLPTWFRPMGIAVEQYNSIVKEMFYT